MPQLNPKERFKKSSFAKEHKELVVKDSFIEALETALNQYVIELPRPDNPAQSYDGMCKIEGARQFIYTLLNLAEDEKEYKGVPQKNLKPLTTNH